MLNVKPQKIPSLPEAICQRAMSRHLHEIGRMAQRSQAQRTELNWNLPDSRCSADSISRCRPGRTAYNALRPGRPAMLVKYFLDVVGSSVQRSFLHVRPPINNYVYIGATMLEAECRRTRSIYLYVRIVRKSSCDQLTRYMCMEYRGNSYPSLYRW